MVHSFIQIKVTILFLYLNLLIDYEEELMVAYLPHNRCSKFSVTSSAQLPMALSVPITFSHMYTLGLIPPLRQRGVCFLFLYRTTEVLWASHKVCHVPKRPENFPMAVTCKGMTDRLPVRRSVIPLLWSFSFWVWSSACPWCFIPKRGTICWIFQQGCLMQTVGQLGKNKCRKLLDQLKWVEVMGRAWVQEHRGDEY